MEQNYNSSQHDFLWSLLANPANDAHLHAFSLQRLVNDFPQSGILQALLAHASDEKNLKRASVYFNSKSLHKLINTPSSFTGVPNERIVVQSNLPSTGYNHYNAYTPARENVATIHEPETYTGGHENYFSDHTAVETEEHINEHENLPAVLHETEDLPAVIHHSEDLPAVINHVEDLPAVTHENEQHVDDTPATEHHYLADAIPALGLGAIIPVAEEFIEHKFGEFAPTVSSFIHPKEETTEQKPAEPASPAHHEEENKEYSGDEFYQAVLSYIHPTEEHTAPKIEEAHEAASAVTQPLAENIAHKADEVHNTASSYLHGATETVEHKAEETHDTAYSYLHQAEESIAPKIEEAHDTASNYLHQATEGTAHTTEETHNTSSFIQQGEAFVEHKIEEVSAFFHHPEEDLTHKVESFIHQPENLTSQVHPVEDTVEHKLDEAHESISSYIHPVEAGILGGAAAGFIGEAVHDKPDEAHQSTAEYIAALRQKYSEVEPTEPEKHEEAAAPEASAEAYTPHTPYTPYTPEVEHPATETEQHEEAPVTEYQAPPAAYHYEAPVTEYHQPEQEPVHQATYHQEQPVAAEYHQEPAHPQTESMREQEEKLIAGSMASADFFAFNRAYETPKQPEPTPEPVHTAPVEAEHVATEPEAEVPAVEEHDSPNLARYFDEQLPYTFMWWLDKTRREHAGVFQPYVEPEKPVSSAADAADKMKSSTDELQQQYYENIFHITSVDELDKHTTSAPYNPPPNNLKKNETVIMERFIKEEPVIRPQNSEKIDNENKAKKSSEDRDELVTETLAAIYSDQMLYHKAIASYKKLILKFPEKTRYFADKIEDLEKKTN